MRTYLVANAPENEATTNQTAPELGDWDQKLHSLSWNAAASAGFAVADISGQLDQRFFIAETRRSRTVESRGEVLIYGAALRLMVTVAAEKLDASLNLPIIAAKAEIGAVQASAQLSLLGFPDDRVGRLLPALTEWNVQAYGEYLKALSEIQKLFTSNSDRIRERLLERRPKAPSITIDIEESFAVIAAIEAIADGITLDEARDAVGEQKDYSKSIERAYGQIAPGVHPYESPPRDTRERARAYLDRFRV